MSIEKNIRIRSKIDTKANWESNNPQLLKGEIAIESDTGKIKIGTADGEAYNSAQLASSIYISDHKNNGSAIENGLSPMDSLMIDGTNCNFFSFISTNFITIQYSNDGGSSWTSYTTTNEDKTSLCLDTAYNIPSYYIGGSDSGVATDNDLLKITIKSSLRPNLPNFTGSIAGLLDRLFLYVNTNGAEAAYVTIEYTKRTTGSSTATYSWLERQSISGSPGWNSLPAPNSDDEDLTFGNNHIFSYIFTFGVDATSIESNATGKLCVSKILAHALRVDKHKDYVLMGGKPYYVKPDKTVQFNSDYPVQIDSLAVTNLAASGLLEDMLIDDYKNVYINSNNNISQDDSASISEINYNNTLFGINHTINGYANSYNLLCGIENTIQNNYNRYNLVGGSTIQVQGDSSGNMIIGNNHTIQTASNNIIGGIGSQCLGSYNIINGRGHTIMDSATANVLGGTSNTAYTGVENNLVVGTNNTAVLNNSIVCGVGNAAFSNSIVLGTYNNPSSDSAFIIGNGTSFSDYGNSFEIKKDGTVYQNGEQVEFDKTYYCYYDQSNFPIKGELCPLFVLPAGTQGVFITMISNNPGIYTDGAIGAQYIDYTVLDNPYFYLEDNEQSNPILYGKYTNYILTECPYLLQIKPIKQTDLSMVRNFGQDVTPLAGAYSTESIADLTNCTADTCILTYRNSSSVNSVAGIIFYLNPEYSANFIYRYIVVDENNDIIYDEMNNIAATGGDKIRLTMGESRSWRQVYLFCDIQGIELNYSQYYPSVTRIYTMNANDLTTMGKAYVDSSQVAINLNSYIDFNRE